MVMYATQQIQPAAIRKAQDEVFMYREKENQDPNFGAIEDRTLSSKDSV